jgi:hypothetical protein
VSECDREAPRVRSLWYPRGYHAIWGAGRNEIPKLEKTIHTETRYLESVCDLIKVGVMLLTLTLLMSYIYGASCKARNFNVVYIRTYVWQP